MAYVFSKQYGILNRPYKMEMPDIVSSSLVFHGEGNGNPLQYSCLETPVDGGALWAAVHGVAQSRTRLK